jgi:hypothetical protein
MSKGEAKVTLTADISNFTAGLHEAKSQLHDFGSSFAEELGPAGEVLTAMGPLALGAAAGIGAIGAAAEGVIGLGEEFASWAAPFADMAVQTGIASTALQQFAIDAQLGGTSLEAVGGAINKMEANVTKGAAAFGALGLSIADLKAQKPEDEFQAVIDKINDLSTTTEKVGALKDVFGKSGAALLPFIEEMERGKQVAEEYGLILSDDDVKAGKELEDQFKTLKLVGEDLWHQLGAAIAPSLIDFLKTVTPLIGELGKKTQENKGAISGLFDTFVSKPAQFAVGMISNVVHGESPLAAAAGAYTDVLAGGWDGSNASAAPGKGGGGNHYQSPSETAQEEAAARKAKAEEDAANKAAEAWYEAQVKMENDADEAAAKWLVNEQKKEIAAEIFAANAAATAKQQSESLDTQFAQAFVGSIAAEQKQFDDDIARQDAAWHEQLQRTKQDWDDVGQSIAGVDKILQALGMSAGSVGGQLLGMGQGLASGIGGFLDTLKTGNLFDKISSGIGLAATAVSGLVGVFKSLFGHDEGKAIGADFGGALSDGLVKAIESTETKDHVGRALAEDLNIDAILKETGADPASMMGNINDLMNAVKLGAVPAKDGIDALGKAFTDLQTAAAGGSTASEAAMTQMILRARELGEHIPELDAAVGKMVDDAMAGLDQFYKGLSPGAGGKGQAAANNALFDAMFKASAAQLGLVDAFNKFQPTFDDMVKAQHGGKLTGSAAEFAELEKLMKVADYKGAASGAAGLAQYDKNLGDAGFTSQKTTDAISKSLETLFNQALKGAGEAGLKGDKAENAALKAVLPELVQLQHDQEAGAKLSPQDQKLLAEAQKEGLLPMKTLAEQQLDALKQIAANTRNISGGYGGGGGNDYRNNTGGYTTAARRGLNGQT